MNEQEILLNAIQNHQSEENYECFDQLILNEFFSDIIDTNDISILKTDNYGDAGIDYIFMTCNRVQFYEFKDIDELLESGNKNNMIDIFILQIKESQTLDSNVPNKFLEFSENITKGTMPKHYNQEINDFIYLYTEILKKYVTKIKFNFHFYYFSKASKNSLKTATDLNGRFITLKDKLEDLDYCKEANYYIKGCSDIFLKIQSENKFEYIFNNVEKFEAEVDNDNSSNAVIALIPIKQYYQFISTNENEINSKLFDSNIRDFKGRSFVNNNIKETLSKYFDEEYIGLEFWWLNNGITITVEDLSESKSQKQIRIVNPQIVNGLQTSYSIFNYFKENPEKLDKENRKIFIKILKILPDEIDKELRIIVATNSQNEIRDKDIHANDKVQKNIELFFKEKGKYYQRKDKYYTNRKLPKNDIIKLSEMAKYINTIFLKDPSFTRNNPGKLLKGKKYEEIFNIKKDSQSYERYYIAYCIYEKISQLFKGKLNINGDQFDKRNFVHHIVYISIIIKIGKIDYTPQDIMNLEINDINENLVNDSKEIFLDILNKNQISNAKILKVIKEQQFTKSLNSYLNDFLER